MNNLTDFVKYGHSKTPPPLLAAVPAYLWRPFCTLPCNKKRRRGKRGGVLVRFKAYLASLCTDVSGCSLNGKSTVCEKFDLPRSLEFSYRWLQPALPDAGCLLPCCRPVRIQVRGCVRGNLCPLNHATQQSVNCRSVHAALINTRSLTNKTFILNDLISTHDLDFLMLTETWLKPGDNSAFSELLPPGYSFLSTPRVSSRGGGLASVFKQHLNCRLLPSKNYSSFELQLFLAPFACPLLCAVVYRPPKYNKDFILEFSELLGELRTQYDSLLICGDFNIHVCCPSSQLSNDFQSLLISLDLTQSVKRCRQAERKWKKDKLHVSLGILRDSLTEYQNAVKAAKCQYLSNVISTSSYRPRALFNTIQSQFSYFVDKVASVKQSIKNMSNTFDLCSSPVRSMFNVFEPVSLPLLSDVVQGLRLTNCPLDIIPSKMLKQVFNTVGPCLLSFINSCLSSGSVPTVFKHAVVRPLLKKTQP